jgi:hypothetical protein
MKQTFKSMKIQPSSSGKRAARDILVLASEPNISPEIKERISRVIGGDVDWQYLLDLAETHSVVPLIAAAFLNTGLIKQLPQQYSEQLKNSYHTNLYKNLVLNDELIKFLAMFRQHSIPVISLKGTVLADQLYGNIGLRTVSDIDILVQPDKLAAANSLILELGYEQFTSERTWDHPFHVAPYFKRGQFQYVVELHYDLENPDIVTIPQEKIWQRAQQIQIQGTTVHVLSMEDNFLYLANTFSKPSNFILKTLCDINELLKKHAGILDWNYILDSARSWQMETALYSALKYARDIFESPIPGSVGRALEPKPWRRRALEMMVNRETFLSPIKWKKLKVETYVLHHTLMMVDFRRMSKALSKHRGYRKKASGLRTGFWMTFVVITALGRKLLYLIHPWANHDK